MTEVESLTHYRELLALIAAICGAGLLWTGLMLWAVKAILAKHTEHADKALEAVLAQIQAWRQTSDQRVLDLERKVVENYVHRRELDDLKSWMRDLGGKVDNVAHLLMAAGAKRIGDG